MPAFNQDFITFTGNAVAPIFTVQDGNGNAVDISTAAEIKWYCQRNETDGPVLIKTLTSAQIAFVTDGTNGQFYVNILTTDTLQLSDWYQHLASITDGNGNITTVAVGRMQVAIKPNWTWVPSLVGIEPLYTVRNIIGDTIQSDQLLTDQQIEWANEQYSNEWLAAAECARNIAIGFARQVDIGEGALKKNYSQRSKQYFRLAADLEQRGYARGGVQAYTGGTSIADKENSLANSDRVPPNFLIAMHDNLLPESPVGLQSDANLGAPQDMGALTGPIP